MIHDILRLLYHNIELIRYFVLASWCLSYLNQRCTNFFVACFLLTNSHTFLTLSFRYQGLRSVVWRNSTKSSAKIDLEGLWHDNFFFQSENITEVYNYQWIFFSFWFQLVDCNIFSLRTLSLWKPYCFINKEIGIKRQNRV